MKNNEDNDDRLLQTVFPFCFNDDTYDTWGFDFDLLGAIDTTGDTTTSVYAGASATTDDTTTTIETE